MKKRLLCLAVVLLMVLPVILTGCDSGKKKGGRPDLTTITLAMIKGENTTEAGIQSVENALNQVIEQTFGIHVDLQAYAEEEYYEIVEGKLANTAKEIEEKLAAEEAAKELAEELKKKGITTLPETTVAETTSELLTYLDEDGKPVYVYPEAGENQVDILLLTDMSKYYSMVYGNDGESLLYDMTEQLAESHKALRKQIHPNFMNAVTIDGMVYGIPNNHLVGENTYLLLNKEICTDQLDWEGTEFQTLPSLGRYLKAVDTYCPGVTPLYNLPDDSVMSITDEFSLLGSYFVLGAPEDPAGSPPRNVLQNGNYRTYLTNCYTYRSNGWVVEGDASALPEEGTYAAAFLKGGQNIVDRYSEDYYVFTYATPMISQYDLFRGVYCVSKYSEIPETCMEIIAMLTTDVEFRNIFQYGAEGETYIIDEVSGMIVPNTEGDCIWDPNPVHTGNQFIMYQNANMTQAELDLSANEWAIAKTQNVGMWLDAYATFPVLKIDANTIAARYETDENIERDEEGNPVMTLEEYIADYESKFTYTQTLYDEVVKYSASIMERIKNFEEYVDEETGETVTFNAFLNTISSEVTVSKYFLEAVQQNEKIPDTLMQQYVNWRNGIPWYLAL